METQNVFGPLSVTGCTAVGQGEIGYTPFGVVASILFDTMRVELPVDQLELQRATYVGFTMPVSFPPEIDFYLFDFRGYVFAPEGSVVRVVFKFAGQTCVFSISGDGQPFDDRFTRQCRVQIPESRRTPEVIAHASILIEIERTNPSMQVLATIDSLDVKSEVGNLPMEPTDNAGCEVLN